MIESNAPPISLFVFDHTGTLDPGKIATPISSYNHLATYFFPLRAVLEIILFTCIVHARHLLDLNKKDKITLGH